MSFVLPSGTPSVHMIFLSLSFSFTYKELLELPPHASQYLCYRIVDANVVARGNGVYQGSIIFWSKGRLGDWRAVQSSLQQASPVSRERVIPEPGPAGEDPVMRLARNFTTIIGNLVLLYMFVFPKLV